MIRTFASRIIVVAAIIAVAFAAPAALAGKGGVKGGNGGGKTGDTANVAVVLVNDVNGNGASNWGDTITFNVTTTATDSPWLEVACYQAGKLVYSAWAGFYDSYPGSKLMPLWSPSWTGGAADCAASLNGSPALTFGVGA